MPKNFSMATTDVNAPMPLGEIIDGSPASKNKGSDFYQFYNMLSILIQIYYCKT